MIRKLVLGSLTVACLGSSAVAEAEDGLYGSAVPEDAIFVRAVGVDAPNFDVLGRKLTHEELPDGIFVAFAPEILPLGVPNAHYSVFTGSENSPIVIKEADRAKPSKVYLTLINLDADAAALAVAGGGPDVIANVAAGEAASRGVNPVNVTLEARVAETSQEVEITLQRKQHMTFVVRADGSVEVLKDTYGPVFEGETN